MRRSANALSPVVAVLTAAFVTSVRAESPVNVSFIDYPNTYSVATGRVVHAYSAPNGGIIVIMQAIPDISIIKVDPDGQVTLSSNYTIPPDSCGVSRPCVIHAAAHDANGDAIIVVGAQWFAPDGRTLVVRLSGSDGQELSRFYLSRTWPYQVGNVAALENGDFLLYGVTEDARGLWITRLSPQGDVVWEKIYRKQEFQYAVTLIGRHIVTHPTSMVDRAKIVVDQAGHCYVILTMRRRFSPPHTQPPSQPPSGGQPSSLSQYSVMFSFDLASGALRFAKAYEGWEQGLTVGEYAAADSGIVAVSPRGSAAGVKGYVLAKFLLDGRIAWFCYWKTLAGGEVQVASVEVADDALYVVGSTERTDDTPFGLAVSDDLWVSKHRVSDAGEGELMFSYGAMMPFDIQRCCVGTEAERRSISGERIFAKSASEVTVVAQTEGVSEYHRRYLSPFWNESQLKAGYGIKSGFVRVTVEIDEEIVGEPLLERKPFFGPIVLDEVWLPATD